MTDSNDRWLIVRRVKDGEEVHRVNVTGDSERAIEKCLRGMLINMDTDRFFIVDTKDGP